MDNDLIKTKLITHNVNSKHPTEDICQHLKGLNLYDLMTTTSTINPIARLLKDWLDDALGELQKNDVIENFKVSVGAVEKDDKSREIQIKIRFKQRHCLNFTHIEYIVVALLDNKMQTGRYSW